MILALLAVALLLALANGANDNFKGVATLLGSRTGGYRTVLAWATLTTFLGSLAAILLAGELLARFQGKGLVPPEVVSEPSFVVAVGFGAAATVLLATRVGMPTSTTHALIGALVGAGLAVRGPVHFEVLASKFIVPLLASPVLALVGTAALYPILRSARRRLGVEPESCLCLEEPPAEVVPALDGALAADPGTRPAPGLVSRASCPSPSAPADDGVLALRAAPTLDRLHYLSAGAMSFARGLNDTPKIAALLLVAPAFGGAGLPLLLTGLAIALGGWIGARRVAETMSYRITPLNAGQGFTTNVVTSVLVGLASPLGLPVSTTHVSNGALFGLGLASGEARWRTIVQILLTWILTLPAAALLAFAAAAWSS